MNIFQLPVFKNKTLSQVRVCWRAFDLSEFQASLVHIVRPCLNKQATFYKPG